MKVIKDIEWFKNKIEPKLVRYKLEYKSFKNGDFGSLNQVEFNSSQIGGNIDFWELGWIGFFVWDYQKEKQLLNILLEPNQEEEKEKVFEELQHLLL
ncbi:hypothetical protein [Pedobacter terrae]|uniref:hypothetical protein n=1 Tax=Pedobacter terrae TaxID=405671 RepID=UPI002FF744A4